jgi:hypothetical protein
MFWKKEAIPLKEERPSFRNICWTVDNATVVCLELFASVTFNNVDND